MKFRDKIGAVVISDYRKGVVTRTLLDGIRKAVSGRKITVCVDPKQSDFSLYQGFDIITPNHLEAGQAAGIEIQNGRDVIRAGTVLLERYDFKALLITRGEQGMSLFERDGGIRHTHLPTQAKEVYDVTGCGRHGNRYFRPGHGIRSNISGGCRSCQSRCRNRCWEGRHIHRFKR